MKELTNEELEKVTGGTSDNPKGLKPGDSVYFYYDIIDNWMWGTFLYYDNGLYRVRWNDTKIISGSGIINGNGIFKTVPADEDSIREEYIK